METIIKVGATYRELGDLRLFKNFENIFFLIFPDGNTKVFLKECDAIKEMNYAFYKGIAQKNNSFIINPKAKS